jgi:hypothetical protein
MEKKGGKREGGSGRGRKCLGSVLYNDYFSNNGSGLVIMWKRAGGLVSVLCDDA